MFLSSSSHDNPKYFNMPKRPFVQSLDDSASASAPKRARPSEPRLECPFALHPLTQKLHIRCRKWKGGRAISDLRIHFDRCHYLVFCDICYLVFDGPKKVEERDAHQRRNACIEELEIPEECRYKITHTQFREMFARTKLKGQHPAGMTEKERKWRIIWQSLIDDNILPHAEPPSSIIQEEQPEAVLRHEDSCEDVRGYNESDENLQKMHDQAREKGIEYEVVKELIQGFVERFASSKAATFAPADSTSATPSTSGVSHSAAPGLSGPSLMLVPEVLAPGPDASQSLNPLMSGPSQDFDTPVPDASQSLNPSASDPSQESDTSIPNQMLDGDHSDSSGWYDGPPLSPITAEFQFQFE
ncbi:hypothetical protein QBC38DRAFT_139337 [Podospora fimiseda]|uniref:Uncharacterized protein n=1 Tax=Podospora fimiseda TaxID=252190 RepID=A0AAN6YME1_9PEZI|nr:hypothetical protein QBC38DRAFT_139337 [Podospora fimiseda]